MRFYFILFFILFNAILARADRSFLLSSATTVGGVIAKLPTKAGCTINEYLKYMLPEKYEQDRSVGQGNAGLVHHMSSTYRQSKCFRVALHKFYNEIDKAEELVGDKKKSLLTRYLNPRLNSSVDQLGTAEVSAGWLFEKAKKIAGGDPNLALQLIAFCGHDDVQWPIDDIHVQCPKPDSLIYFPDSLFRGGSTPDYVKELLSKNRQVHDHTAAKNYHVLTGAFLGCKLAETCGLNATEAAEYERYASYLYRTIRLKQDARTILNEYKHEFSQYVLAKPINDLKNQSLLLEKLVLEKLKLQNSYYAINSGMHKTELQLKEKAKLDTAKLISFHLYDTTNSALSIGAEFFSDNALKNKNYVYDKDSIKFRTQCRQVARDQCENAKKILDNYNADFVWTMSQHSVGASFGAQTCATSKKDRAGAQPSICSQYEKEPDISQSNMTIRRLGETYGASMDHTVIKEKDVKIVPKITF